MIYALLFTVFLKTGFFTFGGGLVIIPFLQKMVGQYGWFTNEELTNIVALSQMTPGALGVNMATYAGFMTAGIGGGIVATLGLCGVSLVVPPLVMKVWKKIKDYPMAISVFNALKAAVAGLITGVFCTMSLDVFKEQDVLVWNPLIAVLFVGVFVLNIRYKINNIVFILGCGVLGILLQL